MPNPTKKRNTRTKSFSVTPQIRDRMAVRTKALDQTRSQYLRHLIWEDIKNRLLESNRP